MRCLLKLIDGLLDGIPGGRATSRVENRERRFDFLAIARGVLWRSTLLTELTECRLLRDKRAASRGYENSEHL
jgi:hypothetical protein